MDNFEIFKDRIENGLVEDVDNSGGYLTFIFRDGLVMEVLGEPTEQYPGYTDIQIKKLD